MRTNTQSSLQVCFHDLDPTQTPSSPHCHCLCPPGASYNSDTKAPLSPLQNTLTPSVHHYFTRASPALQICLHCFHSTKKPRVPNALGCVTVSKTAYSKGRSNRQIISSFNVIFIFFGGGIVILTAEGGIWVDTVKKDRGNPSKQDFYVMFLGTPSFRHMLECNSASSKWLQWSRRLTLTAYQSRYLIKHFD